MIKDYELAECIRNRIAELPVGYISRKNINGKTRYYLQWKENGKVKSKYIREEDVGLLQEQIEERKRLQKKLKDIEDRLPKDKGVAINFETNVTIGESLVSMVSRVRNFGKRDIYPSLTQYIYSDEYSRVCAIYGLRRTGKTTMLYQAIADMSVEDFQKAAYIKLRTTDKMDNVNRDLDKLYQKGYRYIFIDEVTLMEDFIDSAALFSDIYVPMGMKIILSGTDSLGFWFANSNELYDRVRMLHTTYISFREFSRLLGIDSIDEYIRYGGTLSMGEKDFDNEDAYAEGAPFRDDESTRRYIDTSICRNIQHSLNCSERENYFSHLYELYEAGELTNAINRIIEDINHRIVREVIEKDFRSHDLGQSARNLRKERDPAKRTTVLSEVDVENIHKSMMTYFDIRNKEEQTIGITRSHTLLIERYLKALDLIEDCPVEQGELGIEPDNRLLISQPGMRYCQAEVLVHILLKDDVFKLLPDADKEYITERILQEVRGRMLEEIILLETAKTLGKNFSVFKLQFSSGEFDMVIRDKKNNICAIYEIKHSRQCVREQARHLIDDEKIALTTPRFGTLVGRFVLYLGNDMDTDNGVAYRNAEVFLKNLPDISLISGLEKKEA